MMVGQHKGHRAKLIDADEVDAFCRRCKARIRWRPGARKLIKRKFNKRQRTQFKSLVSP